MKQICTCEVNLGSMFESSRVRTFAGFVGLEVSDIGADMSALESREFAAWCDGLKRKKAVGFWTAKGYLRYLHVKTRMVKDRKITGFSRIKKSAAEVEAILKLFSILQAEMACV